MEVAKDFEITKKEGDQKMWSSSFLMLLLISYSFE